MKSICNIKINGTHIYGRLCTVYFFDGSFLSRSDQKRIIYFFFKGIGVFSSWRIQMFIYTHKQIKELIFDEFLHEIYLFYKLALSQTIAENLRSVSLWLTTSRNSLYHIICLLFKTELLWFLGCCFFFVFFGWVRYLPEFCQS